MWAAFFNFVAAFVFGTAVAKTIGDGMVNIDDRDLRGDHRRADRARSSGILITWYYGLPTSSSHALIGGYAGAAVAKAGYAARSSPAAGPRR